MSDYTAARLLKILGAVYYGCPVENDLLLPFVPNYFRAAAPVTSEWPVITRNINIVWGFCLCSKEWSITMHITIQSVLKRDS